MRPVSTARAVLLSLCLAVAVAADPPAATPAPTPAVAPTPYSAITDAEIAAINFDEVPEDNGWVTPLTDGLDHLPEERRKDFDEWLAKLDAWEPGKIADPAQRTRNLLAVASMCDIGHGEFEGEAAYGIFQRLKKDILPDQLKKICAWIYLHPDQGTVVAQADGLGVDGTFPEDLVRERIGLYAQKLLGRLLGKLPYVPPADPATPDKDKPATPDKDKPAAPDATKPTTQDKDKPATPDAAKPASPATPDNTAKPVAPAAGK